MKNASMRGLWLLVLGLSLAGSSCSKKVRIQWFNESGEKTVISCWKVRNQPAYAQIEFLKNAVTENHQPFVIKGLTNSWYYEEFRTPQNLLTSDGLFKIQISTNGVLHYLSPRVQGVTNASRWQPPGFPVKPKPIVRQIK